jgi:DNA-binding HxlR family transcriptional regulator
MNDAPDGLAAALARVGDRWTLLLVDALRSGPARFSDLEREVPGISTNILTARLKELERQGIVVAEAYSQRPLRHEYALTAAGTELAGALDLLADWGSRHGDDVAAPRHHSCGTPLQVRWYCPTCARLAGDDDEVWYV